MFFLGGFRGQKGLTQVPGWEAMDIPTAAQTVEQSEYNGVTKPFAENYKKNLDLGLAIAAATTGTAPVCSGSNVAVNGVQVTIPDNQFVIAQARGKVIAAPNAAMAKALAAGFAQLGLPYVWGGGNAAGGGPDNGCARGGGAKNSCGAAIGFDCSGLTAFVLGQGNPNWKPGTQSGIQRAGGIPIAYAQGLPGDIVGFPGHVAIFLGAIDGVQYILEASDVGIPIHIVQLRRTDKDANLHRYWTADVA
jgi:cell wall-associated NlpC family hydrolase